MNLEDLFRIGYHNWFLVAIYIALAGVFVYGVLRPRRRAEWSSMGVAQAWVVALYAEMYGLPLTMYALAPLFGDDLATDHFKGHFWPILFGSDDPFWFAVTDIVGQTFIVVGTIVALVGWRQIHRAVREERLASTGLYGRIRHPQYTGFFLFLVGSSINWPTIPTLLMLPVLLVVYYRLALAEERDAREAFGEEYEAYMGRTGRFLPKLWGRATT